MYQYTTCTHNDIVSYRHTIHVQLYRIDQSQELVVEPWREACAAGPGRRAVGEAVPERACAEKSTPHLCPKGYVTETHTISVTDIVTVTVSLPNGYVTETHTISLTTRRQRDG